MDFPAFVQKLTLRLAARPPRRVSLPGTPRKAAVVAIFRAAPPESLGSTPGEPELLLIRRAEVEGDPWSGHVAFPGGRMDPEDDGPVGAALREVQEELRLDLASHGRILGELSGQPTLPQLGRQMLVHPYVAVLDRPVPLHPNGEVAHVLWVPWRHLVQGEGRGTMRWQLQGRELVLPCRRLQGEVLWGMTLRMVEDLLSVWGEHSLS
jgi:8-oxo-dGTP pyrophosphatase MutT (NUDIX family)